MKKFLFLLCLILAGCGTRTQKIQVRSPSVQQDDALIVGYGTERIGRDLDQARQSAYLKAIDDLLLRAGPLIVSKTIESSTTAVGTHLVSNILQAKFTMQASRVIVPRVVKSEIKDGSVWVMVGTTEADFRTGFQQFLEWRNNKRKEAEIFLNTPPGRNRLPMLEAGQELLKEIKAPGEYDSLYFQMKAAMEAEKLRLAELEKLRTEFEKLIKNGSLIAAEQVLAHAMELGLENAEHDRLKLETQSQRARAIVLISAGDVLFRDRHYEEALQRYREAQRLDNNRVEVEIKIAVTTAELRRSLPKSDMTQETIYYDCGRDPRSRYVLITTRRGRISVQRSTVCPSR